MEDVATIAYSDLVLLLYLFQTNHTVKVYFLDFCSLHLVNRYLPRRVRADHRREQTLWEEPLYFLGGELLTVTGQVEL